MKFKKVILMGIISIIVSIGFIIISDKSIVSDSLSNVVMIRLSRDNLTKELYAGECQEDIDELYGTIESTRVVFHEGDDGESHNESEPDFIVEIHYKSGKIDQIRTSETGEAIYREVDNSGSFYRGSNRNLKDLVIDKLK